jgi:hypothetical protein
VAEVDTALEELLHRDDRAHGCGPSIRARGTPAAGQLFALVALAAVAEAARGFGYFLVLAGCPITPSCQPLTRA